MSQDANTPATTDDDLGGQQRMPDGGHAGAVSESGESQSSGQASQSASGTLSYEAALQALEKARRDAARYRTERNELRGDAEKWKEHEDTQKSELQRTLEKLAETEQQLAREQSAKLLLEVAATHGIKHEDMALLGSGTKDELEARAARIKELYGSAHVAPPSQQPRQNLGSGSGVDDKETTGEATYPSSWVPAALRENNK